MQRERVNYLENCQLHRERIRAKILEAKSNYQMFDKGFIVESNRSSTFSTSSSSISTQSPTTSPSSSSGGGGDPTILFGEAPPPPGDNNQNDIFAGFSGHRRNSGWEEKPLPSSSSTSLLKEKGLFPFEP